MIHTYKTLLEDLKRTRIDPHGVLLVHSSMKAIGEVAGGAETVLDVLCTYMQNGLLVLPTHTWREIPKETTVFYAESQPSCVGILSNLFLKRSGVVRSLHPTHSVAALGAGAADFIAGEASVNTPCGKNGCWGKLHSQGATILFIGCLLNRNTYIHGVEEWNHVPDRLTADTMPLTMIEADGTSHTIHMHRHHSVYSEDISENYVKLDPVFRKNGAMRLDTFGDATCRICDARKMYHLTSELLQLHDIQLFATANPIPKEWY